MKYIVYVVSLVFLAVIIPFVALSVMTAIGFSGMVWSEGFSQIAGWSYQMLKFSLAMLVLAGIHLSFTHESLTKLLSPFFVLLVGLIIIPVASGFISVNDAVLNPEYNAVTPIINDFASSSTMMVNALILGVVQHGTGLLFLYSAIDSILTILCNQPNKGPLKKLSK